jgi:hypothetical protein
MSAHAYNILIYIVFITSWQTVVYFGVNYISCRFWGFIFPLMPWIIGSVATALLSILAGVVK